jgi:SAM-dependent methyltransferase
VAVRRRIVTPTAATARDQTLLKTISAVLEADQAEYDPWLYTYCGEFGRPEKLDKWRRHYADLIRFGRLEPVGRSLLDAGCGFGFGLLVLAELGFCCLAGVETHPGMLRTIEAYMPLLPPELQERIDVRRSSIASTPFAAESFDVVISNEAISHYRDVKASLAETHRVLKRGGVLLVADSNNARNPRTARQVREVWRAFEFGADGLVHGHTVETSFLNKRRAILRRTGPELASDVVDELALKTSGFDAAALQAAAQRYLEKGTVPESVYRGDEPPFDPEYDQVIERLVDPYALAEHLEHLGFRVKVRGYWGGANGRVAVRAANRILAAVSPISIVTARQFRVAAWKA